MGNPYPNTDKIEQLKTFFNVFNFKLCLVCKEKYKGPQQPLLESSTILPPKCFINLCVERFFYVSLALPLPLPAPGLPALLGHVVSVALGRRLGSARLTYHASNNEEQSMAGRRNLRRRPGLSPCPLRSAAELPLPTSSLSAADRQRAESRGPGAGPGRAESAAQCKEPCDSQAVRPCTHVIGRAGQARPGTPCVWKWQIKSPGDKKSHKAAARGVLLARLIRSPRPFIPPLRVPPPLPLALSANAHLRTSSHHNRQT